MPPPRETAQAISAAFLAGAWEPEFMAARAASAVGEHRPAWLLALAQATREWFTAAPHDAPDELARFVASRMRAPRIHGPRPEPQRIAPTPTWRWQPAADGPRWPEVLRLDTVADLAARLELDDGQLAWLADARGWERTAQAPKLRNYRYRWLTRAGALPRLIEQPKARLKESQRIVLREILDAIPAHDAAHGFVRGRSVRTHAARHVGARVVIGFDLEDFFASVGPGRVFATFRSAAYGSDVAHVLTALCTNRGARRRMGVVAPSRARPRPPPVAAGAAAGHGAPAPGSADLPRAGQPCGVRPGPAPERLRRHPRRHVLALRRRSGVLGRRAPAPPRARAARRGPVDRARRGLPGARGQVAPHDRRRAPASVLGRRQPAPQRAARGVRPAQGDPP